MKKIILPLFAFLVFFQTSVAQWQKTNGPYGGSINCMASIGKTVFAGTNSGVFISTDMGKNWMEAGKGIGNKKVQSFTVDHEKIFAMIEENFIFVSSDKGLTWDLFGNPPPANPINLMLITGKKIVLGTYDGICISADSGKSWIIPTIDSKNKAITCMVSDGKKIYAGSYGGGVFVSSDEGNTWTTIKKGLYGSYNFILSMAVCGNEVFASENTYGVYRLDTVLSEWKEVRNGWTYNGEAYDMLVIGKDIYAGTNNGIYKTSDQGESWKKTNEGMKDMVNSFTVCEKIIFAGTTENGVYSSDDKGNTWKLSCSGIAQSNVNCLAFCGKTFFAGTESNGMFSSQDKGESWIAAADYLKNNYAQYISVEGKKMVMVNSSNELFFSEDCGISWEKMKETLSDYDIQSILITDGKIFQGTTEGIFVYSDSTDSWISINTGLPMQVTKFLNHDLYYENSYSDPIVDAIAGDEKCLFACVRDSGVYCRTEGYLWTAFNNGLPQDFDINCLAVSDNFVYAAGKNGSIYFSTLTVDQWQRLGKQNSINGDILTIICHENDVYAGTDNGVFHFENEKGQWKNISSELPEKWITSVVVQDKMLYAGTKGNGVWKISLNDLK